MHKTDNTDHFDNKFFGKHNLDSDYLPMTYKVPNPKGRSFAAFRVLIENWILC